jgi:diacylglycerol O-acyltransferase
MASDRLTPLDSSFLHLEDATGPMHVGCVMVFAGAAPDYDGFVSRVEERLDLVPRYRQRLAFVPLGQGRPKWVDDAGFDPYYHMRSTALPEPGGDHELRVLAGRLFSRPLRRDKPLWELWLVEGLAPAQDGGGERFAVISKTHHALVDGMSGLDILSALFAPEEQAATGNGAWHPGRVPSGVELLGEALVERALSPRELVRPVRAALRGPRRVLEQVGSALVGVGALAWAGLRPAPSTPYNRALTGPDRRIAFYSVRLDEVKAIKNALGGTVNDVVLTIVARALRLDLERRGADVRTLHTFVPVSTTQTTGRAAAPGNNVTGMVVRLPVACADPLECLSRISEETRAMKESGQALGAQALTGLGGLAPPTILDVGTRLSARQRFINLVVTNVPGPQHELAFDGRALLEILPMVPIGQNLALSVGIISYNGTMSFGLVGDFDALPDLDQMVEDIRASTEELAEAAGVSVSEPAAPGPDLRVVQESVPEEPETLEPVPNVVEPDELGDVVEELMPDFKDPGVEDEDELVAESSDQGAADGAHSEIVVDAPWPDYRRLTAQQIVDRLNAASSEEIAVVRLFEGSHRGRRDVMRFTERALNDTAGS